MSRAYVLLFLAAVLTAAADPVTPAPPTPPDPLRRFATVAIKPTTTSIVLGSVTMTITPFQRRHDVFSATYYARVFPYFFYSERGHISILVPDADLRRVLRGESIAFTGRGVSEDGEGRKIEGTATPTGPTSGKLRVRVFVTRHISLTYDTTYELTGGAAPAVTPK